MDTKKDKIVKLLQAWIDKRPGLDPRDYGQGRDGWRNYRRESAHITEQKRDAQKLLNSVASSQITAEDLIEVFPRAFSGRLELTQEGEEFRLSYCTGQYFPTEYRAAAAAVLASALWNYHREDYKDSDHIGDELQKAFKRMFGEKIAERWF